jgi:hypothetical protein
MDSVNLTFKSRIRKSKDKEFDKIKQKHLIFDYPPLTYSDPQDRGWLFCAKAIISSSVNFPARIEKAKAYAQKQNIVNKLPYYGVIKEEKHLFNTLPHRRKFGSFD